MKLASEKIGRAQPALAQSLADNLLNFLLHLCMTLIRKFDEEENEMLFHATTHQTAPHHH